jgi:surface protein
MYEAAPKNEIELLYKNDKQGKLKIFSKEFIDNNKNKCNLLINNKKFNLLEYCTIKIKEEFIQVKLIEKLKITDLSHMFENCPLYSIYEKTIWNTNDAIDMSYMFYNCFSLTQLPDISKWNINNVRDLNRMFYGCISLQQLPDIS